MRRREFIARLGGAAPADFGRFIGDETEKSGKVVKASGIKPD
jgi:hypothetical protein